MSRGIWKFLCEFNDDFAIIGIVIFRLDIVIVVFRHFDPRLLGGEQVKMFENTYNSLRSLRKLSYAPQSVKRFGK